MWSNANPNAPTVTYEQAVEYKRSRLVDVISAVTEANGSKMAAYKTIGNLMNRSPTWVRRVVGRSPSVRINMRDVLIIRTLHDQLCTHLAAGNDTMGASNKDLWRQVDVLALAPGDHTPAITLHRTAAASGAGGAPISTAFSPDASAPDSPGTTVLGLPLTTRSR